MAELSSFDRLVQELSLTQRKELLERIERSAKISQEPLITILPEKTQDDIQAVYEHLSLFKKILLFLKALFAGKKKQEILEEVLLNRLKKQIAHQTHGLVDFKYSLFLEEMKNELDELSKAAFFFKNAMLKCFGKEKSNFIAFLGSFELPSTHERLVNEVNPRRIIAETSGKEDPNIKLEMERRLRDILDNIPEEERKKTYLDSQALYYLYSFCMFPFEELLERFNYNHFKGKLSCEFSDISKKLVDLAEIMQSVVVPPSVSALKAVFLYFNEDNLEESDFNLEDQLTEEFKRTEEALVKIRLFNKKIPLVILLKIVKKNYCFSIEALKGGEDWLVLYKNYWLTRLGGLYKEYMNKMRINKIEEQVLEFLKVKDFPQVKYYHPHYYGRELVIGHWRSLALIKGFALNMFPGIMLRPLKILLVNGEFYKDSNRVEFTDCFNYVSNLGNTITAFEKKLTPPEGEYALKLEKITENKSPPKIELKNTQMLFKKIDSQAREILDQTTSYLQTLKLLVNGVLYSEMGGKYDTISNIGFIGGRENPLLVKDWEKILHLIRQLLEILNNIRTIELSM
ncbi:MAG: hypothetical protein JW822_02545 [Spirochaetales bacterium]|nr:hypothetical protein [Spirochaetales bacterium]